MTLAVENLGLVRYAQALEKMNAEHQRIVLRVPPGSGVILRVEHPPVVTMGNRYVPGDMVLPEEALPARGIDFHRIDRGGSVTVHEPGQAVIYPLVKLDSVRLGVKRFVWCLEEAMIEVCAEFGVVAARDAANPGVWVGSDKVGAVGIRVASGVSKHGLAFNVCNDLSTFATIVPCGLRGKGVTSLAKLSGERGLLDFETVSRSLAERVREKILASFNQG